MKLLNNYGETNDFMSTLVLIMAAKVCKILNKVYDNGAMACTRCPYHIPISMEDHSCTVRAAVARRAPDFPRFEDPCNWKLQTNNSWSETTQASLIRRPTREEISEALTCIPLKVLAKIVGAEE